MIKLIQITTCKSSPTSFKKSKKVTLKKLDMCEGRNKYNKEILIYPFIEKIYLKCIQVLISDIKQKRNIAESSQWRMMHPLMTLRKS